MLQSIYIQNYALIDTLDISFTPGFSVITGETGAGKSIILGAIGLLLGQRADIKAIKKGANKCIVEARFNISAYQMEPFFTQRDLEYDPDECIIRRELYASGKSRAFINDTPASLAQMKELGEKLIDVHSQHQNLLLNSEGFQLNVLDILAQDDNELSAYKDIYTEYRNVCKQLADFITQAEQSRKDEDYIRFQLEQLDDATEATFCNVPFLLAENRNVTLSIPLLSGSLRGFSSTTKRTLGIPRGTSRLCICLSMCLPDWERSFVNTAACFITLSYSVSFWAVSSAIRSSKEVMAFSFS